MNVILNLGLTILATSGVVLVSIHLVNSLQLPSGYQYTIVGLLGMYSLLMGLIVTLADVCNEWVIKGESIETNA